MSETYESGEMLNTYGAGAGLIYLVNGGETDMTAVLAYTYTAAGSSLAAAFASLLALAALF